MSLSSPLISVVIPAYNCEKTIWETLNSVLQQTYPVLEVIVVNDGSTDKTLEVVSTFEDSRLKILSHPNSGVSASRNRGIANAKGDFIALLDADDIWLPEKLAEQKKALDQAPQAAIAYSWTHYIDEEGNFLRAGYHCQFKGNVYKRLLLGSFLESGSNPLIRRSALQAVGGFDESLRTCEDWDLWIRLAVDHEFTVVPRVHIKYRVATNSKSFNLSKHEAGGVTVINKAFAQAPDSLKSLRHKALSAFYKYLLFKALDAPQSAQKLGRRRALLALKYLSISIYQDPRLLRQTKVWMSATAKILVVSVLPNEIPKNFFVNL